MNAKTKLSAFFLVGCAIAQTLAIVPKAQALQPQSTITIANANLSDTAERSKPAVVRVENGCQAQLRWTKTGKIYTTEAIWFGSGFFISSDGNLVTNAHVVSASQNPEDCKPDLFQDFIAQLVKDGEVDQADWEANPDAVSDEVAKHFEVMQEPIPAQTNVVMPNGDRIPYRVVATEPSEDVALLKINRINLPTLKLGNSDRVRLAQSILTIGFPGIVDSQPNTGGDAIAVADNQEPTVNSGEISALKPSTTGSKLLQISAAVSQGNSGGPVLNDRGEVIGMVTFGPEQSGFAFAVTSNTILKVLEKVGMNSTGTLPQPTHHNQIAQFQ